MGWVNNVLHSIDWRRRWAIEKYLGYFVLLHNTVRLTGDVVITVSVRYACAGQSAASKLSSLAMNFSIQDSRVSALALVLYQVKRQMRLGNEVTKDLICRYSAARLYGPRFCPPNIDHIIGGGYFVRHVIRVRHSWRWLYWNSIFIGRNQAREADADCYIQGSGRVL